MKHIIPLPEPFSTNAQKSAGYNSKVSDTKLYKAWKVMATKFLSQKKRALIQPRVDLHYYVGTKSTKILDIGNVEKSYTDALVSAGIIKGDYRSAVRSVSATWVEGSSECYVEIVEV